jgi:hypothetical protein
MKEIAPRLDCLPPAQRALWPALACMPPTFVLYGGTAIAVQLGGRESVDFDFFTNDPITPDSLRTALPLLREAELAQQAPNTASFFVNASGEAVQISIFGGLKLGRVGEPAKSVGNNLRLASLLDLAAQKVKVVQVRAERKDYLDLDTLIRAGITLADGLAAARALYPEFAPTPTLKALSYFEDGDLPSLDAAVRLRLAHAAAEVGTIPPPPSVHPSLP